MFLSGYHVFTRYSECGEVNTEYQRNVIIFSSSYFIYDFFGMLFNGILDGAMMLHHPLSAIGLFLPLYENISGNFVMSAIFISEISNPPMTLRHILRLTGLRYTRCYEVSELSFIALYFYARILAGTPIIY
mmetsp:Transcript_24427/g.37870  ORF Transcript_24427/g.37870 Transcript_24427/m.37870 type:complete len:131 (+) Transcript_24427:327-719(+)